MTKRILLCDDNLDDVDLTLRAFDKMKIANKIDVVSDGEEAIYYIENHKEIALVLLDLKLPKVDGFGVLKYIRQNEITKFLPVVILTTSEEERDMVKGYTNGANSYIKKPVNYEEFYEAVRVLGLYWLLLNRTP